MKLTLLVGRRQICPTPAKAPLPDRTPSRSLAVQPRKS